MAHITRMLAAAAILPLLIWPAHAQNAEQAPRLAIEARKALAAERWREIEPGLSVMLAMADTGLTMTAFRISPDRFRLDVAVQKEATGERVEVVGPREGAVIAVNGGFFAERVADGHLSSVGLLRTHGRDFSPAWPDAGGFLMLSSEPVAIRPSVNGAPENVDDVLQSRPLLIEPGGVWAMNTNQGHVRRRTIVCLQKQGDIVLFTISRRGLSLYEAGWLMRGPDVGGYFDCDTALALDGGGSTQLWVAGHPDWSFSGETPVHNVLLVRRR